MALSVSADEIGAGDVARLPRAEIILLGEVHDNPVHHANQAAAVSAIAPAALVFEMFGPEAAARAAPVDHRDGAALAEALGWEGSGWPDFAFYPPVIVAAGGVPLYGAEVPRENLRAVVADGAAGAFEGDATLYGLDASLPKAEQAAREAEQMANHCDALPEDLLPGMVRAQRLRDATLARTALAALDETGGPVVVITGNGHARRDRGVPVYLEAARPGVSVLSVGQLEAEPESAPPFDVWIISAPAERGDPCAAFR